VSASRVLLVGLPRITNEMIKELLDGNPDVMIVGERSESDLADAVSRTNANVVILAEEDTHMPAAAEALIDERALRVLAITEGGRAGLLAELVPRRARIGELTAAALLLVLKGVEV
jgi:chemotaxis response regulator CheB